MERGPEDQLDEARRRERSRVSRDYRVVAQGLFLERASSDVMRALRGAGVRAILLKGPLQQWWLEAGGPIRASRDVDVLVRHGQLEIAGAALGPLGYSRTFWVADELGLPTDAEVEHSADWVAADRPRVELHWTVAGADATNVWDVLATDTETVLVAGEEIEIPNEPARCMIVALHAAHHGVRESATFNDLEKALRITDSETWRRAAELARAVDGWGPFAGVLSMTSRGRELLAQFGVAPPVLSERQALGLLTGAPTSRGFYFLSRERGFQAKLSFLLLKLAPSPKFMRMRYVVARRGRLGLAVAYLYRPFWLLRWAPPGLRSWRQARRLAEENRGTAETEGMVRARAPGRRPRAPR